MIAYDNRIYYNKQKEPFYDPEWEEAEHADEKPQYYIQDKSLYWDGSGFVKYGIIFKKYKPAVAKLVMQRTDMILTPWNGESDAEIY